jgi:septal ring factor EnvC (AmiA/AmiB activator)
MIVQYEDEYETVLFKIVTDVVALPSPGDQVVIDKEEYVVKSRTFYPDNNGVVITVTESAPRAPVAESNESGRLNQVNSAILQTNKRIDATEKKNRALNEQIITVRKHINQRIRQDKKDSE